MSAGKPRWVWIPVVQSLRTHNSTPKHECPPPPWVSRPDRCPANALARRSIESRIRPESPYSLTRYIVTHAFQLINTRATRYVDDRAGHRRAPLQKQDRIGDLIGSNPAA